MRSNPHNYRRQLHRLLAADESEILPVPSDPRRLYVSIRLQDAHRRRMLAASDDGWCIEYVRADGPWQMIMVWSRRLPSGSSSLDATIGSN